MRTLALAVLALVLACVQGDTRAAGERVGLLEVDAALARAKVPGNALYAVVQEVGGGRTRFQWQADVPTNPASLMKVVTTAAALDLLGPAWTWNTPVWVQGPVADGVLQGDLVLKGSGDPKLVLERVWLLLRRVRQFGVREIHGDIVVDRSAFVVPDESPADFDNEPLRPYNAHPDALLLNYRSLLFTFTPDPARGLALIAMDPPLAGVRADPGVALSSGPCEDWRGALRADFADPARMRFAGAFPLACGEKTWAVAYADPKSYAERLLPALWQELGGTLTGRVREGPAPSTPPAFEVASPPLAEVVRDMNKYSNNVMAQQLFLTLGAVQRGVGSPDNARAVLKRWLEEHLGAPGASAIVDNGSGLSRDGRLSARALAQVLQWAWNSPSMPELMSSFPVAGIDGTMKRAQPLRAHLKTGSLRDVAGIAGYVQGTSGRRYVVVAIVNHANANAARPALDALLQWAAEDLVAAAPTLPR
jgi:D-alanyl-D-alanine carboxypeptidase/D-alanyl-D-alanine-endopeptidase (penicillin-binding protein 4)